MNQLNRYLNIHMKLNEIHSYATHITICDNQFISIQMKKKTSLSIVSKLETIVKIKECSLMIYEHTE